MENISPELIAWLIHYRYFLLFPLAVIEGPFITVVARLLAALGQLDFATAYGVIVVGDLAGDSIYYFVGRFGGRKSVEHWEKKKGMTSAKLKTLEGHFKKHPGKTLFTGKLAHGFGGPFLLAAGLAKMPYKVFLWYNLLPTIPKSMLLIVVGYYFGGAYFKEVNQALEVMGYFFLLASLVCGLIYIIIPGIAKRFFREKI